MHAASGHPLGAALPRRSAPPDLRLVPPALAAWLAAAFGLCVPGRAAAAGAALCGAASAVLLLCARRAAGSRRRTARVTAALALLAAAAGGGGAALHAADLHRGPLPELARERARVTVDVTVEKDPRLLRSRVSGARAAPGAVLLRAEATRVVAAGRAASADGSSRAGPVGAARVRAPLLVLVRLEGDAAREAEEWLRLLPSTGLRLAGRLDLPSGDGARPGQDVAAVLRARGGGGPHVVRRAAAHQRVAGRLRAGLREAADGLGRDARGLLPGLVTGDTSRLAPDLEAAFRTTGMTHLLAVSGSNLTIMLAVLLGPAGTAQRAERRGLAPRLGIGLRGTAVLAALLTLGFVLVCRPDASVLRAAACGLIAILALATGRRRSLLPALAAPVLALVLADPWLALDFGFLLSVLATGSLLTVAPHWSSALRRAGVPPGPAEALAAACAAQAACAPVVAVLSSHVSLVAVPCNLLAEFLVAPATVLGFAALAAAPAAPAAAEAVAWLAGWPARGIALIARSGAALPGAEIDWPGNWAGALLLAVAVVGLLALLRVAGRGGTWLRVGCAVLFLLALLRPAPLVRPLTGWPPPGWRLVMCDVGQGDALVLATGQGRTAVVVDTGPEPEAVDRCLDRLGVTTVPAVVLSHFHADHVGGLSGVLNGRSVGAIVTTGLREPADQAAATHRTARSAGVPVLGAGPGERRRVGGLAWQVLWPPAPPGPGVVGPGGPDGANNASVTLLVRAGGLTLFLPGDLEPEAQRGLLAAHPGLPSVDVLKVAHHGSGYQDAGLLARLNPRIALISCGADNPYGHPAPRTLAALRAGGAVIARTDLHGAVAATFPAERHAGRAGASEVPRVFAERGEPQVTTRAPPAAG